MAINRISKNIKPRLKPPINTNIEVKAKKCTQCGAPLKYDTCEYCGSYYGDIIADSEPVLAFQPDIKITISDGAKIELPKPRETHLIREG